MTARHALSADEIDSRWPRVRASVPMGDVIALVHGRVVGKTIDGRVDVRSDDGTLHVNIPIAHIRETL